MNKHIHIQGEAENKTTEEIPNDTQSDIASPSIGPSSSEPTSSDDIAKRLEETEQKAQDNYDRLLRVSAEFDNFKKRSAREMQDVIKYANEKLASELLNVVDNLERALASAVSQCGSDDPLLKGVSLVLDDILKVLDRHHVKPIDALGQPFDPSLHQAMMQEPSDNYPPNMVVREMQKGYLIHDRLLRPTLVAVSVAGDNQTQDYE